MKNTGLYVHIPFCVSKCAYCDFLSAKPENDDQIKRYISSLAEEIREKAEMIPAALKTVDSVFFGGGTPTLLDAGELIYILDEIKKSFDVKDGAEISIECNPGTAKAEAFKAFGKAGFNRISFGLQSAVDEELKILGRIHTFADFLRSFYDARAAGFENINVDIISAVPGQTIESFMKTLDRVTGLKPEHISCYRLILEEGTPLCDRIEEYPSLPGEDEEREMYNEACRFLGAKGYLHYEISNFCLKDDNKDFRCRHNLGYWDRAVYFGFGAGAAGFDGKMRYKNITDVEEYIRGVTRDIPPTCSLRQAQNRTEGEGSIMYGESPGFWEDISQREVLTKEDAMAEFMILGLRKTGGVSGVDFYENFGKWIEEVYGEIIEKQIKEGTLEKTEEGYRLTSRGVEVSNPVLAEYM